MTRIIPMDAHYATRWRQLWRMNVGDALATAVIDHTEKMILDDHTNLFGLLAVSNDDEVIGLLHGVVHPVAGSINPVCYMQDLFVHPAHRRQGIAKKLLDVLATKGRAAHWDRIYWLTDRQNNEAQALYKNAAITLDFSFHILPIGMLDTLGAHTQ
jgi:ribosomal protein S18 acetylase RimI-like enzyme